MPAVTVVIPARDAAATLGRALPKVLAAGVAADAVGAGALAWGSVRARSLLL